MNPFRPSCLIALGSACVLIASPAPLPAAPLTQEQIDKILAELDRFEGVVTGKRTAGRRSAVDAFRRASGSDKEAYEFYLACVKELDFDRQGKSFTEFRDWRSRQEDRLKTPSRMAGMRLQLQWLVLTLRAAEGEDRMTVAAEAETFLGKIVANAKSLGPDLQVVQRENVLATPFGRLYELDQSVKLEDWAYSPGNIGQMYERVILPPLRENAPAHIAAAWDRRIQLETEMIRGLRTDDPAALEQFTKETLPRLKWQRAADLFQHGEQQEGALAMVKLIGDYPEHPDAAEWITGFRRMLMPPVPGADS